MTQPTPFQHLANHQQGLAPPTLPVTAAPGFDLNSVGLPLQKADVLSTPAGLKSAAETTRTTPADGLKDWMPVFAWRNWGFSNEFSEAANAYTKSLVTHYGQGLPGGIRSGAEWVASKGFNALGWGAVSVYALRDVMHKTVQGYHEALEKTGNSTSAGYYAARDGIAATLWQMAGSLFGPVLLVHAAQKKLVHNPMTTRRAKAHLIAEGRTAEIETLGKKGLRVLGKDLIAENSREMVKMTGRKFVVGLAAIGVFTAVFDKLLDKAQHHVVLPALTRWTDKALQAKGLPTLPPEAAPAPEQQ
ncbi:MAG: hypothetical protein AB7P76_07025 [Candidatus Melainabacteria bacterium]